MSVNGLKLVTFDVTNTLLKFRMQPWHHYAVVAKDHGFTGTSSDLKERLLSSYKITMNAYPNFGKSKINWDDWWKLVVKATFRGQLPPFADYDKLARTLIEQFQTSACWSVAEGSEELLLLLRALGVSIGVISNFDPRLDRILDCLNLHHHFDFVLNSYDVGYSKPDEMIFKEALYYTKLRLDKTLQPSESLHIGDHLVNDYQGARNAGWHAILVSPRAIVTETPPAPEHVFKSLEDISLALRNGTLKFN